MEEITLSGRLPFNNSIYIEESKPRKLIRKEQAVGLHTYLFILLFMYAGLRKLVDLNMFVKEVWGFAIFGSKLAVKGQFILLSSVELMVAILLSIPRTRLMGWYTTLLLMIAINLAFFYMQQFAKVIPLYFGGIIPGASFIFHLFFNIIVLFLALLGMLYYSGLRKK